MGCHLHRNSSKKVATLRTSGDTMTKVEEVPSKISSFVPFAFNVLALPDEGFADDDDEEEPFFGENLSPGWCQTQFEQIIGMAIHTFMYSDKWWKTLQKQLLNYHRRNTIWCHTEL